MLEWNIILFRMSSFDFQLRHLLVVAVLAIAFTTAFIMRSYPVKYGFYLNEFDPYFNYRATKYIVDHGIDAYLKWHDTMSWYPEGRDIAKTSQAGLHIVVAFLYNTFTPMIRISLLDFTIILPVILGSMTTIVIFVLVRTIGSSTTAGMFSALLFAFSPVIIQRGNLGWFKSEPLGLFFGLLALYLFISAIKHKKIKYALPKAVVGGLVLGIANASWGGAEYFTIPISLFLIVIPFFKKDSQRIVSIMIVPSYVAAAITFTIFTLIGALAFPRPGISFLFSLSGILLTVGTAFLTITYFLNKISQPRKKFRNTLVVFVALVVIVMIITASRTYYVGQHVIFDLTPRYFTAINPFYSLQDPIDQSVAEHAKPTLTDYFQNYSTLLIFAGFGIWAALKCRSHTSIFALIVGLTAIYVSTGIVRLQVYAAIGIIILSGIGIAYITQIIQEQMKKKSSSSSTIPSIQPSTTMITKKTSVKKKFHLFYNITAHIIDKRLIMSVIVIALIIFILFLPLVYPQNSNWIVAADIPPTILSASTDSVLKTKDWLEALQWISKYTPKNAVIASWWDYGYWITTMANRTTLADNAGLHTGIYKNRIPSIAKMLMDTPEDGIKVALNLKADYILIYLTAERILINGTLFYILGDSGDESKLRWFVRIGGFDENTYLQQDQFTPRPGFWNTTLLGKLIPLVPYDDYYTSFENGQPTHSLFRGYKPGAFAVYSEHLKYPKNDTNSRQQELSLVYSSPSFLSNNSRIISAMLIYKVNYNSYFQKP